MIRVLNQTYLEFILVNVKYFFGGAPHNQYNSIKLYLIVFLLIFNQSMPKLGNTSHVKFENKKNNFSNITPKSSYKSFLLNSSTYLVLTLRKREKISKYALEFDKV